MPAQALHQRLPQLGVPVIFLLVISLVYAVLVIQNIALWVFFWGSLVGIVGMVLLVYLFHRLVVAVEKIAESM
jgi:membrane associated rhomboid family serine protease